MRKKDQASTLPHIDEDDIAETSSALAEKVSMARMQWATIDGFIHSGYGVSNPLHLRLILAHLRLMGPEGLVYASNKTLSEWVGCTEDHVRKLVKELVGAGILENVGTHGRYRTRVTKVSGTALREAHRHGESIRVKREDLPRLNQEHPAGQLGADLQHQPASWVDPSQPAGSPPASGLPNPISNPIRESLIPYSTGGARSPREQVPLSSQGECYPERSEEKSFREVPPARDNQPTDIFSSESALREYILSIEFSEYKYGDESLIDLRAGSELAGLLERVCVHCGELAPPLHNLKQLKQRLFRLHRDGGIDACRVVIVEACCQMLRKPKDKDEARLDPSIRLKRLIDTINPRKAVRKAAGSRKRDRGY